MNHQIEEIRAVVNNWFSFKTILPPQDIMPHLVYLLEQYDLLVAKLEQQSPPR